MKNRYCTVMALSSLIISIILLSSAMDRVTETIMPFVTSNKTCLPCHEQDDIRISLPYITCSTYCLSCHKNMKDGHHPLDVRVKVKNSGMKVNVVGRVACFTCHDLNRNRTDSIPLKAESLFDSVFRGSKEYKTYYLTVNNRNGDMCKKCH